MNLSDLRQSPLLVVDLETTGFSADHDRAIEVAAVRLVDGRVEDTFESLLQPGIAISPRITRFTGITDLDVRERPSLEEVLPHLLEMADGAVIVAHHLAFDLGFLQRAAAVRNQPILSPGLCTLRLARRCLPTLRSHRLGALIQELGIEVAGGHRALPHALATAEICKKLLGLADDEILAACLTLPPARKGRHRVSQETVQAIADGPGVYLLKDEFGRVVYVGKSVHLRRRVQEHLRQRWHPQPGLRRRLRRVVDVDVVETATEIEALFMESQLIRRYQPDGNVADRRARIEAFVQVDMGSEYPSIQLVDGIQEHSGQVFGPFGSRVRIEMGLRALRDAVGICQSACVRACRPLMPRHCLGPCGLNEGITVYRAAVESALALLRGSDLTLVDLLRRRRDHLADGLHFEAAAAIRDRLYALERIIGDERWMRDVREYDFVVVLTAEDESVRKLALIRSSRLESVVRAPVHSTPAEISELILPSYSKPAQSLDLDDDAAEEMRLVQLWLRRTRRRHPVIPIDRFKIAAAADAIASVFAGLTAIARPHV